MLRALALILTLTVLFSTVGLVVHDHGVELERGYSAGYDCVIDHHDDHQDVAPSAKNEMRQSGKLHRHQCVGCHFSSQRTLLASYREIEGEIVASGERVLRPSGAPRVLAPSHIYSLRGPPAV